PHHFAVPLQGEPFPHHVQPRRVEAERDEDDDGQVQKREYKPCVQPQQPLSPPAHYASTLSVSWLKKRTYRKMRMRLITVKMTDAAAPKGQSRAWVNCRWIKLPIKIVRAPPKRSMMKNRARDGMNTKMDPAMTPGIVKGSIAVRNACHGVAPKAYAARSMRWSNFSMLAYKGSTIKGSSTYTRPNTEAPMVYKISMGSDMMPRPMSHVFRSPLPRRMIIHAYVRVSRFVQKGMTTSSSSTWRRDSGCCARKYAKG